MLGEQLAGLRDRLADGELVVEPRARYAVPVVEAGRTTELLRKPSTHVALRDPNDVLTGGAEDSAIADGYLIGLPRRRDGNSPRREPGHISAIHDHSFSNSFVVNRSVAAFSRIVRIRCSVKPSSADASIDRVSRSRAPSTLDRFARTSAATFAKSPA